MMTERRLCRCRPELVDAPGAECNAGKLWLEGLSARRALETGDHQSGLNCLTGFVQSFVDFAILLFTDIVNAEYGRQHC